MKLERHSPSSLNLFCASPAMYVLERILGHRQPVGAPAHRGTAVEAGVADGLIHPDKPEKECIEIAKEKYAQLMALSGDPRRDSYAKDIPGMVTRALEELRPYGVPSSLQKKIEGHPEGVRAPIVGFSDFEWEDHGILIDLKTTASMPSKIKLGHARQVALYAMSDNYDARLTYITPAKRATYRLENIREHREALRRIAMAVERFLALSDDPAFFVGITAPDTESFYWADPNARQKAFEVWSV
jgi:CRISPR/Cas system-associated exonuclease Cas4 (RecB family)